MPPGSSEAVIDYRVTELEKNYAEIKAEVREGRNDTRTEIKSLRDEILTDLKEVRREQSVFVKTALKVLWGLAAGVILTLATVVGNFIMNHIKF
jgi:hypothetical protein